ncbi:MAG: putative glycoside hydrolase [Bacillota bacterium]|nr:putative glycoside hydrolase [Bacillota bacterium]
MSCLENNITKTVLALVVVAIACMSIYVCQHTASDKEAFVAAKGTEVQTYTMADDGSFSEAATIARGTKLELTGREAKEGDRVLVRVKHGENELYINEKNLTADKGDTVREKTVYVRTPATIYENEDGPDIAGFAPKGTELKVEGFDKVNSDGVVNRYKVEGGYVYGKYMAFSQEEADANYNENGVYDKAKKQKYGIELYGGRAEHLDYYPCERPDIKANEFCAKARAMYLNYYAAIHNDEYIKLIKESDCNAVVIDIKSGILSYESPVCEESSPTAFAKAHVSKDEFVNAVREFNDAGIYTIGRITVFSDKYYAKDHPEDCIKTKNGASWPSAYDRDVWEYNVKLALESIELMGFNEIQFDYVRFPEEAYEMSVDGADFRNEYDEEKAQAIQNFCFYAADQIHEAGAYISIDVFGECSNGFPTACGQYWPAISNVVDAISSMPYTDHFGDADTWSEPKNVMSIWAAGAAAGQKMIPTPAAARTWITGYNTPYWNPTVNYDYEKLKEQIDALDEAGLDGGFIPWNSESPIDKYRQYQKIWNK